MKYKFKITYTCGCFPTENKTINKDEIVEIVKFREAGSDKFVSCLNEEGDFFVISLDALRFCAEEYYEPQKRKVCPTCKHKEKCEELTKDWGIFLLGDTCARYEEKEPDNFHLTEKDKKEVCWKCRRFRTNSLGICQNYEEGMKCRVWFDDNGNRINGEGKDCL